MLTIFSPGPAVLHVVVAGIPSEGKFVMAGNGKIGKQIALPLVNVKSFGLPPTGATTPTPSGSTGKAYDGGDSSSPSDSRGGDSSGSGGSGGGSGGDKSAAPVSLYVISPAVLASVSILAFLVSLGLF